MWEDPDMRRPGPAVPLTLALVAAALADGPGTSAALRTEVEARLAAGGLPAKKAKVLEAVAADLADDASLADEAGSARRAAAKIRRSFRSDDLLKSLLVTSADAVEAAADADRTALGPALPGLPATEAAVLRKGFDAVARLLRESDRARSTSLRLSFLAKACRRLDEARTASSAVPVPGAAARPDFALKDANTSSSTHGRRISPRSRLGSVSAWYFGHST